MTPDTFHLYRTFVLKKAAAPHIVNNIEFELLHCALGLATEILELQQSTTSENTEEELGDLLWYLTYTSKVLNITIEGMEQEFEVTKIDSHANFLPQNVLAANIETFVSKVKKKVIYRQEINIETNFVDMWMTFCYYCKICNLTLEGLIDSNIDKLNKRYEGSFTKEESISRNDKEGTEA